MIVIREFRVGNKRYLKGDIYRGEDGRKWLDAGFLQAKEKGTNRDAERATVKKGG